MPRLLNENRDDFVRYLRRKINEQTPIDKKATVKATYLDAGLTQWQYVSLIQDGLSHSAFDALFKFALERNLRVPVKIRDKVVNLIDPNLVKELHLAASKKLSSLDTAGRNTLIPEFSKEVIHGFGHGTFYHEPERKYEPSNFMVFCLYAKLFGRPVETLIFPSGKVSKGKHDQ